MKQLINNVCNAVIGATDESWSMLSLDLKRSESGGLVHVLAGPGGQPGWCDDNVFAATHALDQHLKEQGHLFKAARFTMRLDNEGWVFECAFVWPPEEGAT